VESLQMLVGAEAWVVSRATRVDRRVTIRHQSRRFITTPSERRYIPLLSLACETARR
jgi:hypothetical protein